VMTPSHGTPVRAPKSKEETDFAPKCTELGCHPHDLKLADDIYAPISPVSCKSSGSKSTFDADPHRAWMHGSKSQLGRVGSSVI
jgi:hypothetical protein